MSLKERTYSILVVSSTDSFASAFIGSLPEIPFLQGVFSCVISIGKISTMLISATGNVNISPAIRVPTRKILIAYSAIALCMYWEIAAAESLPTFPTDTRTAAAVCFPICGRIMV